MYQETGERQSTEASDSQYPYEVVSRRSTLEVRMEILQAIMEGARRSTEIKYKTDLSWFPLLENLNSLIVEGFVNYGKTLNRKSYSLTEKGVEMVSAIFDKSRVARTSSPVSGLMQSSPISSQS